MLLIHSKYGGFLHNMFVMCVVEGLHIKKRRGRKSKAMSMLQRRGTVLKSVTSPSATSFVMSNSNVIVDGADQGVICSTQSTNHQQVTTSVDKKQRRNMLLMKAKADKARKRAEVCNVFLWVTKIYSLCILTI